MEDVATWPQCLRYLEQAQRCDTLIRQYRLQLPEAADVLHRTGVYLAGHASYPLAESLFQRALAIWEQQVGPEHPLVASALNGLASLYREQGKYAEAELLYQRALTIREQQLEPNHPQTAETIHDLATLREQQGHHQDAQSLYRRALTIRERVLGAAHPITTETRTCLLTLLHAMGQHEEAALLEAVQQDTSKLEHEQTRAQEP